MYVEYANLGATNIMAELIVVIGNSERLGVSYVILEHLKIKPEIIYTYLCECTCTHKHVIYVLVVIRHIL
jgi:hypothetical protein